MTGIQIIYALERSKRYDLASIFTALQSATGMDAAVPPASGVPSPTSDFPSEVHLDTLFLYQNNLTGQVSTTHLTARQLCRILCPVTVGAITAGHHLRHLTAETNLLLQEPDGSYCTAAGWTPARNVPVIREAIAWWYYFARDSRTTNGSSTSEVSPAVSCRDLAVFVKEVGASSDVSLSSALTNSKWMTIDQLPYLQTALEAFHETAVSSTITAETVSQEQLVNEEASKSPSVDVERELESFLQSTVGTSIHRSQSDSENEEVYESDGGTRYCKDLQTGNWVHEALAKRNGATKRKRPKESADTDPLPLPLLNSASEAKPTMKRKQKKSKFSAKKGRCWIYVTGLPTDCTLDEIAELFAKAGLLDLDPETQRPKIKLYRYKHNDEPRPIESLIGQPKGDASICYARPESVELAVTLLDNTPFRMESNGSGQLLSVQAAKFEQRGQEFDKSRNIVSKAKRKVAKLATMQAMDWDEGEFNGRLTGGRKGLHIVVLKHVFDSALLAQMSEEKEHECLQALDDELRVVCEEWGTVDKVTFFSKNPDGVAVVKFAQPGAASDAVRELEGRDWKGRCIAASFWDGVTDYTVKDEEKEETDSKQRETEFGSWLESQELPEELRLKTDATESIQSS